MSKRDDGFELYFQIFKGWEIVSIIFYIVSVGASDLSVRLFGDKIDDYTLFYHIISLYYFMPSIFQHCSVIRGCLNKREFYYLFSVVYSVKM